MYNHYISNKKLQKKFDPPRFLPYGIYEIGNKVLPEEEDPVKDILNEITNKAYMKTIKKPVDYNACMEPEKLSLNNIRIELINSNFEVNYSIIQSQLFDILVNELNLDARFSPGSYPGINLKYYPSEGRKISIFIFKSGKIIITSAKKTQELNQAYHFINDILDKYKPYSKLNIF